MSAKKPSRKSKKKSKRHRSSKSGTPFELRARDALQFINPELVARHDVSLPMKYEDWPRQFDVALVDESEVLQKVYEAKDYSARADFRAVEAFEAKVGELKTKPGKVAGVISSRGFQKGPLVRGRNIPADGSELVRDLYHLRPVADADWEGRLRGLKLLVHASSLRPDDVMLTLGGDQHEALPGMSASRGDCFLRDQTGRVVGNLLDMINDRLHAIQRDSSEPASETVVTLRFDEETLIQLSGERRRLLRCEFTPRPALLDSAVEIDWSTSARDTLVDCIRNQHWIIPDPARALRASQTGLELTLDFDETSECALSALAPPTTTDVNERSTLELAHALKLQLLLHAVRGEGGSAAPPELVAQLERATEALTAGRVDEAESLYRASLADGASLIALVNLTYITDRKGNVDEALRFAGATANAFPLEVVGWAHSIHLLTKKGEVDQACRLADLARMFHAGRRELLVAEAEALYRRGSWADAARLYAELRMLAADDPWAWLGLALCNQALGNREEAAYEAQEAWRRGASAQPQARRIAEMLIDAKRFEDAALIVAGMTDRDEAIFFEGVIAHAKGDHLVAYERFEKHTALRPNGSTGFHNLSIVAHALGRHRDAYLALRAPAFDGVDSRTYWAMRTMAAARVGEWQDAQSCAVRVGVEAAALLFAAGDAALDTGQMETAGRLFVAALDIESDDANVLLRQAQLEIPRAFASGADLTRPRARLARAAAGGASNEALLLPRFLLALHDESDVEIARLTEQVVASRWSAGAVLTAAAEAESRRRSSITLRLLDAFTPLDDPASPFPHPAALRASALIRQGRWPEAASEIATLKGVREHPLHVMLRAFAAYAESNLAGALALLDRADALVGQRETCVLPLRLQILIEQGAFSRAAEVLARQLPGTLLAKRVAERARKGDVNIPTVRARAEALARNTIGLAAALHDAEHVAVFVRGTDVARAVMAVRDWGGALDPVHAPDGSAAVVLRATPTPVRTMQSLLGEAC